MEVEQICRVDIDVAGKIRVLNRAHLDLKAERRRQAQSQSRRCRGSRPSTIMVVNNELPNDRWRRARLRSCTPLPRIKTWQPTQARP